MSRAKTNRVNPRAVGQPTFSTASARSGPSEALSVASASPSAADIQTGTSAFASFVSACATLAGTLEFMFCQDWQFACQPQCHCVVFCRKLPNTKYIFGVVRGHGLGIPGGFPDHFNCRFVYAFDVFSRPTTSTVVSVFELAPTVHRALGWRP